MDSKLFDLEHLQLLTFERSKTWANVMDRAFDVETLEEMELDDLEEELGPEFDENDSSNELYFMEDGECDDKVDTELLRNVTNTTKLSLFLNNKAMSLSEGSKNEEDSKLIDIFNQTLPIINEHNRQLKESGFEKILCTFDKKRIEDKVGSWLNRHNSLYGGDNTLLCADANRNMEGDESQKMVKGRHLRLGINCENPNKEINVDSDDSLQSGETGRYVRSSRASAIKNSASTTTMIKTFRMVKSTREALREKYGCKNESDDFNLNTIRHHRRIVNDLEFHQNHGLTRLQRKQETNPMSSHKQKRKVLRKRTYRNSCSTLTSSDSDYDYDSERSCHQKNLTPCCKQHLPVKNKKKPSQTAFTTPNQALRSQQRCVKKMPLGRMSRMYYYSHVKTQTTFSTSSSSTSVSSVFRKRRAVKRSKKFCNDNRPCKLESECHCCNERKLCEKYKHVADTSTTDEWYVENCNSPQKILKTPTSRFKSHKSITPTTQTKTLVRNNGGTQERPVTKKSLTITNSPEETFLTATAIERICNSTALSTKSNAFKRQFVKKLECVEKSSDEDIVPIKRKNNRANKPKIGTTTITKKQASSSSTLDDKKQNKQIAATPTVTSTALHSPEINSTSTLTQNELKSKTQKSEANSDDLSDCTLVTSTTNIEPHLNLAPIKEKVNNLQKGSSSSSLSSNHYTMTQKGILIYNPEDRARVHANSFRSDDYFTITKEHLSTAIGEKNAEKFLKYYIGRKRFNRSSTVYYIPPTMGKCNANNVSSSSDSDDALENLGQYGDLYEYLNIETNRYNS